MTIHHHPDDAMLMAYATGNLAEAFHLIVAAHSSLCDTCRITIESFDALGGGLLDDCDPVGMNADSLDRVLANLDTVLPTQPVRSIQTALPAPIVSYVGGDLDAVKWRPIGMGIKQAILPTSKTAQARLLYIPSGTAVPDHSHKGQECTLVLQGSFEDEGGKFSRGDMEQADANVTHTPIAGMDGDCICLAVTDAPLRFKGWLPKLVQRFASI